MKRSEPLKKRRGKAKTKSFKKSKDEKTITALMCSSALIDTQLFHMTLFGMDVRNELLSLSFVDRSSYLVLLSV